MKKAINSTMESVLNLIFFGDWNDLDDFDEQLDQLAEYSDSVRESVNAFNAELMST